MRFPGAISVPAFCVHTYFAPGGVSFTVVTTFQQRFKRHVTAMRIGYDHATIALVTLEHKGSDDESRGRRVRMLSRPHDSKAALESRTERRPRPSANP